MRSSSERSDALRRELAADLREGALLQPRRARRTFARRAALCSGNRRSTTSRPRGSASRRRPGDRGQAAARDEPARARACPRPRSRWPSTSAAAGAGRAARARRRPSRGRRGRRSPVADSPSARGRSRGGDGRWPRRASSDSSARWASGSPGTSVILGVDDPPDGPADHGRWHASAFARAARFCTGVLIGPLRREPDAGSLSSAARRRASASRRLEAVEPVQAGRLGGPQLAAVERGDELVDGRQRLVAQARDGGGAAVEAARRGSRRR